MNIYLKIFILVVLVTAVSCESKKSNKKKSVISILGGIYNSQRTPLAYATASAAAPVPASPAPAPPAPAPIYKASPAPVYAPAPAPVYGSSSLSAPIYGPKPAPIYKASPAPVYGSSPAQTQKANFYNSLLTLNVNDARNAIARNDHQGIVNCPNIGSSYSCNPSFPWRTLDGSCNNLKFTWWAEANSVYKRLLPPIYGINGTPRCNSSNGNTLENPRTIALKVHYPKNIYIEISNMFPVFGQFVNHDVVHTADTVDRDGQIYKCRCGSKSPNCNNIPIPSIDTFNQGSSCLIQIRSSSSFPTFNCSLPNREQINTATAWVDLSQIYGNSDEESNSLRDKQSGKGKLLTSQFDNKKGDYLPTGCTGSQLSTSDLCFKSGDSRVNQYPLLTSMHTIWMREHNRIAEALWQLNPEWNDELLFQNARTITIAEYQNIIYGSFLEILVGKQFAQIFDLDTQYNSYFMGYDPLIFANTANEYATAAARYGHGLTIPYESVLNNKYFGTNNYSIPNVMYNPQLLLESNALDGFVRGCVFQRSNWFSPHLNDFLLNNLKHDLGRNNPSTGFSLPAWNINRGRDHGIPSYNNYRPIAGLKRAYSWNDLTYIPPAAIARLKQVYDSPDDIDLWTGGMSEYPLPDGVVGPTFAYILARGFRDWKYGDRWFFENGQDQAKRFPMFQLNELRKSSLARILCDNTYINQITANPLLVLSKTNPVVDCQSLPTVNLKQWNDLTKYSNKRSLY